MTGLVRVEPAGWRSGPWANGGGTTHTIATWSDGAGHPLARLSVADIDRAGPFSRFAGHQRWLAVLDDGGGLRLDLAGTPHHLATGAALAFSGDAAVTATPAAPARVLNLIVRRGVPWRAAVVTTSEERRSPPGYLIVFRPSGQLTEILTVAAPSTTPVAAPALVVWLGHPNDGRTLLDGC